MSTFRLATAISTWIAAEDRPPKPAWIDKVSGRYWHKIYWATPPWLTQEMAGEMKRIYDSANASQHVDHIVPLKSALVCGLHVPWNLQVIDAKVNMSKSNNWWEGHPYENRDLFGFDVEQMEMKF